MNRHYRHLAIVAGLALLAGAAAVPATAQTTPAAPPKLIAPVRGAAEIGFTTLSGFCDFCCRRSASCFACRIRGFGVLRFPAGCRSVSASTG